MALSCQGCNNHKYNKIQGYNLVSGETVPLYHPRQQIWNDNFAWNNDFTLVIGLNPTGRAILVTKASLRDRATAPINTSISSVGLPIFVSSL